MKFPATTSYIESLSLPTQLLDALRDCSVVYDAAGMPVMSSGNFGAVFQLRREDGTPRALKCFTRDQSSRSEAYALIDKYLTPFAPYVIEHRYREREIAVYDNDGWQRLPVLEMEWVAGETLSEITHRAAMNGNVAVLRLLAAKFDALAGWLLRQPFGHGDLKPDNIMVREGGGDLTLVDYDGAYLPQMSGWSQREYGTPEFQHPARPKMKFSKAIDHYPAALISVTLHALAANPAIYLRGAGSPGSMFSPERLVAGTDMIYNSLMDSALAENPLFGLLTSVEPELAGVEAFFPEQVGAQVSGGEAVTVFCEGGRYGFQNTCGGTVIEARFEAAGEFSEGLAAVRVGGRWGYVDRSGELAIGAVYDGALGFAEGRAAVEVGGKWGYVDRSGRAVTRLVYDGAWTFREGLGMVRRGAKYGYVGLGGEVAVAARFDYGAPFSEGVACVAVEGVYGYIDRRGRWVVKPRYSYAESFRGGRARAEVNGLTTYISIESLGL